MEQKVVAFAEQLGRMVGTVQAKTEGWLDRQVLRDELTKVRDAATGLLEQLGGKPMVAKKKPAPKKAAASKGRSGGVVDAPGKKHRKPMPSVAGAKKTDLRIAKMRTPNELRQRPRKPR